MGGTFDLWQQAFCLASMAGAVGDRHGDPTTLATLLSTKLIDFYANPATQKALGPWSTVWGPAIYVSRPSGEGYPANAIYVAATNDGPTSTYVIGTAGTNPLSIYDWLQEDLDVEHTATWDSAFPSLQPYGVPSGLPGEPFVSAATALGINDLLGLEVIDGLPGAGQSLLTFLKSLPAAATEQATLIFCGHSLAGALSPTLALALFNPSGGKLDLSSWQQVYVYPTAGPTPGNAALGSFLASVFPPVAPSEPQVHPYQVWNQNVWNTLDVVPHAWKISRLREILTLYPTSWLRVPPSLEAAVAFAEYRSIQGAEYRPVTGGGHAGPYEPIANQPLQGAFHGTTPVSDPESFIAQAGYQHTTAYDVLLDVTSLLPLKRNQAAYFPTVRALLTPPAGGVG
jgi:hypothetical protein